MNTFKLLAVILVAGLALSVACGNDGGGSGGTGGNTIGPGGSGGGLGGQGGGPVVDAAPDVVGPVDVGTGPDIPLVPPDAQVMLDVTSGEAGPARPLVDCTGLTADQCHGLIINPAVLPDGVLPQDPGADPAVPYPSCTAM